MGEEFDDINGNGVYDIQENYLHGVILLLQVTWSELNGSLSNITIDNAKDLAGNPCKLDLDNDDDGG